MTDETIHHIVSESCKQEKKKYKTMNDRVGKVLTGELCKICNFQHTNKW